MQEKQCGRGTIQVDPQNSYNNASSNHIITMCISSIAILVDWDFMQIS